MTWSIGLTLLAVCAAALVLFSRKVRGFKGDVDAAKAEFRQQTGYEYVSALTVRSSPTRRKETPGGVFTHYFEVYSESGGQVTAQTWRLASPRPRVAFQLVEKKMVSTTRMLLNMVGPSKQALTLIYPGPHALGDTDLDARFALYTHDAAASSSIVRQPGLRTRLLAFRSVILLVNNDGAMFYDPTDANLFASGASRMDVNPAPAIRSAARVHIAVEELLREVANGNSALR